MFTVKKLFAFKDYMIFLLIALYFCLCYFSVSNFDIYSVSAVPEQTAVSSNNTVTGKIPDQSNEDDEIFAPLITDTRTLKTYRGAIGIFDCFGALLGSFDIDVALLPYADRKALDDGIVFANENEMKDFLATLDS
ncbi:MAG: hypothetical protein E7621_03420 [Ruminococcaceae bacterium]|nr:hypothetical protein [Oscillospiraceae bacterium]